MAADTVQASCDSSYLLRPFVGRAQSTALSSADTMKLLVNCCRDEDRAFAVPSATIWNSLPLEIRTLSCSTDLSAKTRKNVLVDNTLYIRGLFIMRFSNTVSIVIYYCCRKCVVIESRVSSQSSPFSIDLRYRR